MRRHSLLIGAALIWIAAGFAACSSDESGGGTSGDLGVLDLGQPDVASEDQDSGGGAEDLGDVDQGQPPEDAGRRDLQPTDQGPDDQGQPPEDAGQLDLRPEDLGAEDLGPGDLGEGDQGSPDLGAGDGGAADGGQVLVPRPGFGAISGICGVLDDEELLSPQPFFFDNVIDFGDDPYDDEDFELLSEGGQEIIEDGNAGGSSILSEVFSYEVLHRCDLAELLKTEMEVQYQNPQGKITDILVQIGEHRVGVSVTRAVGFPRDAPYSLEQASGLIERKLQGVLDSSANVAPEDEWVKQILHIIAYAPAHAETMRTAWEAMPDEVKADTIVFVTVSEGEDEFLY